jgi:hypothetical protein
MGFFAYSFKKGVSPKIHLIPMLLLTTQQEIKIMDFENMKNTEFKDNPLGWDFFLILLSISCTVLILIVAQNYNVAGVTIFQYFQVMLVLYVMGIDENQTMKAYNGHLFNWVSMGLGLMTYLYLHRHWVEKF